jgi:hypothetical protein
MSIRLLVALSATVLAASMATSHAGPCAEEIDRMQAKVDAKIEAIAAAGPEARESVAATMNRQPTPASIAAAEERLDEGARAERALAAMRQARAADEIGDSSACDQALEDARRAIGP